MSEQLNCGCECGCYKPISKGLGCQGLCNSCAGLKIEFIADDYDDRFKSEREAWLAGYFSWVDDVPDGEVHTARDGFDAGANCMWNKCSKQSFDQYQDYVNRVASGYELKDLEKIGTKAISHELGYTITGVAGEAGEALEKFKKAWREVGIDSIYPYLSEPKRRHAMALELGDTLYYAARAANLLGYKLSEIAEMHVEKLNGHIKRGTVKGEGDYR